MKLIKLIEFYRNNTKRFTITSLPKTMRLLSTKVTL